MNEAEFVENRYWNIRELVETIKTLESKARAAQTEDEKTMYWDRISNARQQLEYLENYTYLDARKDYAEDYIEGED